MNATSAKPPKRKHRATPERPGRGNKRHTTQRTRAVTVAAQSAFLAAYSAIGVITAAARQAGIERERHYVWLAEYPDYPARFAAAHEQACDRLETAMVQRAVQGWEEPVYQGGALVGHVRKFSDRMLELALKSRRPNSFRERISTEHSGPGGAPIQIQPVAVDLAKLTPGQLAQLRQLAEKAQGTE